MRISAMLLLAALTLPGVAYAQNPNVNPGCDRQAKSICAPALSARLIVASGGVLLSRGVGFAEINSGATLAVGDRLLVKQGSAEIEIGPACTAKLGSNSMATLVERKGFLCAVGLSPNSNTIAADLPSRVPPQLPRQIVTEPPVEILPLPSLLFAGAQFGIVAAIAALDDDERRAFFPLSP